MGKKGTNIYKRKDGRWEGRYIKGYDISGKTVYGYVYGRSYKEAREKQLLAHNDFLRCKSPDNQNKKRFSSYSEEWLVLKRNRVKKSTYIKYFSIITNHIRPQLGNFFPCQLNTVILEEFATHLLSGGLSHKQEGLSPKTVRDILTVLHSILKYIKKQPESGLCEIEIIYPREQKKEIRVLSMDEQYRFTQYLMQNMDQCKFGILLALLTGMRIGEICALRWRNISVEDRMIKIEATMQRLQTLEPLSDNKTEVVISEPKSETSKRMIPLTEQATKLCRKMKAASPSAFVLTGLCGEYMEPRVLQYRLKKYMTECGISGATFHSLRHTFATRCVEADFELKSLSEILGHASVQITLDRYVHSSIELKRENMRKLEAIGF